MSEHGIFVDIWLTLLGMNVALWIVAYRLGGICYELRKMNEIPRPEVKSHSLQSGGTK